MGYAKGSLDELGGGPGFRKVRQALNVTAFGVNGVVYPPGQEGFLHYHDEQDELYFVHAGARCSRSTARRSSSGRAASSTSSRRHLGRSPIPATRTS